MICSLCKFKNIVLCQPRALKECLEKGSTCPESSAWFIIVLASGAVPGVWTGSPSVLRASHRRPASKTWTTARCSWDPSTWWWIEPLKRRFSHLLSEAVCFRLSLPPLSVPWLYASVLRPLGSWWHSSGLHTLSWSPGDTEDIYRCLECREYLEIPPLACNTRAYRLKVLTHACSLLSLSDFLSTLNSYLNLPSNQHGVEAGLDLEDAPSSFGYKFRSQNDDEAPALVNATSQVLDVGCGGGTRWNTQRIAGLFKISLTLYRFNHWKRV